MFLQRMCQITVRNLKLSKKLAKCIFSTCFTCCISCQTGENGVEQAYEMVDEGGVAWIVGKVMRVGSNFIQKNLTKFASSLIIGVLGSFA